MPKSLLCEHPSQISGDVMTSFKTPLPRLMAEVLGQSINEMIRLDSSERVAKRMALLNARSVALCLTGVGIHLVFAGNDESLQVLAKHPDDFDPDGFDTIITGTPQALLAMAIPDWASAQASVRIEGDAAVAQALEQLMRQLDPDWETLWVERFGVVVGHQLHQLFGNMLKTGQDLSQVGISQVSDYVRTESQLVVDRDDFNALSHRVDDLNEAIDRLEVNAQRRGLL